MEKFLKKDQYSTRSINILNQSTNPLNMTISTATNTSIHKSDIVTEYKELSLPDIHILNDDMFKLPKGIDNNFTNKKHKEYLNANQSNISVWAYDIANNHKYSKKRMPLQREWAIPNGIIKDSYSEYYFNLTKHYEIQYNLGKINIYKFLQVINESLTAIETECYYNYQSKSFDEKKDWHYIENIWYMHQKISNLHNNILDQYQTSSSLPKQDTTQYILKSPIYINESKNIKKISNETTVSNINLSQKTEPILKSQQSDSTDSKCVVM